MKRILCLWLPNWPVQRRIAARPELNGQSDRAALHDVARWCERFSPIVGLESAARPESLLLDVTGLGRLFGGEERLAEQVVRELRRRGYTARVAIADTIGAAWAVAHFAQPAKASLVVRPGRDAAVDTLPVEALRLSEETVDLLHQLGVFHVWQVMHLPRAGLAARFSDELITRVDQITGAAREVIVAQRPMLPLEAQWSLEHPTAHRETIGHVVSLLIERLTRQLAARDEGVVELACRLGCTGNRMLDIRVGLFQPTATAKHLVELVRMQWESLTTPGPVHEVSLSAVATAPLVWRQHELFDDRRRQHPRQLAMFIDRLSSRVGPERVVRAQLQAGAQPERAYRYVPLTGEPARPRRSSARPARSRQLGLLDRPLWLDARPLRLEVVSVAPDGPPVMFRYRNQKHHVARHWGPERIETGWWGGQSVQRDYYRIETTAGLRLWLFRRLQDAKWFLHGAF